MGEFAIGKEDDPERLNVVIGRNVQYAQFVACGDHLTIANNPYYGIIQDGAKTGGIWRCPKCKLWAVDPDKLPPQYWPVELLEETTGP